MVKKVLIVTYYWPPSGGGGVQRWLKFAKYLPEFGWEPVIFTPENPDFELKDDSFQDQGINELEVIKIPIVEPFSLYRKILGKGAVQKQGVVDKGGSSILGKLALWIRGNWFIPDARVFWVKPAIKHLKTYLKENPVDVIVTTGPPHSMHLIGNAIKRSLGIPWLADFRDPWTEWDVLKQLNLNKRSWEKHKRLEFEVLNMADAVVTVSKRLAARLDALSGIPCVNVVTNGYDAADFQESENEQVDKFRIVHMGLLNEGRNPKHLWNVLDKRCAQDAHFNDCLEVVLAGTIEMSVKASIASFKHLSSKVTILDYVPHQEALEIYSKAAVLLLLVNQTSNSSWILPGKVYEYFSANKPILALGQQESDVFDMLKECGCQGFSQYHDKARIKQLVDEMFELYQSGTHKFSPLGIEKYERKNLTGELAVLLENIVLH